jgi:hypothetical protein
VISKNRARRAFQNPHYAPRFSNKASYAAIYRASPLDADRAGIQTTFTATCTLRRVRKAAELTLATKKAQHHLVGRTGKTGDGKLRPHAVVATVSNSSAATATSSRSTNFARS